MARSHLASSSLNRFGLSKVDRPRGPAYADSFRLADPSRRNQFKKLIWNTFRRVGITAPACEREYRRFGRAVTGTTLVRKVRGLVSGTDQACRLQVFRHSELRRIAYREL